MSVYIVTDRENGACKIGFSSSPLRRVSTLRVSSSSDLKLEAVIPADISCERILHKIHSSSHIRREWFLLSPDIENLIKSFPYSRLRYARKYISNSSMQTHTEIVRKAGPEAEVAALCGVSIFTIKSWKQRDSIPAQHWATFARSGHATLEELASGAERKAIGDA